MTKQATAVKPKTVRESQIDVLRQRVSDIQLNQLKIEWTKHDSIHPNSYNPNKMTWHDRQLLRQSLLEDGWTQPIVTLPDHTIIDGEQRWTTAGLAITPEDIQEVLEKMYQRQKQGAPVSESIIARLVESKVRLVAAVKQGMPSCIASITGGLVPITKLDLGDDAHKMISTIRHNRARGSHSLDSMTSITQDLVTLGLDFDDLEKRLGMDDEEITRFLSAAQGQLGQMKEELENSDFGKAWAPVHLTQLDSATQVEFDRSTAASVAIKKRQEELAERQQQIEAQKKKRIAEVEKEAGKSLTQAQKDKIEKEISSEIPEPSKIPEIELVKIVCFVTREEHDMISTLIGPELGKGIVQLCIAAGGVIKARVVQQPKVAKTAVKVVVKKTSKAVKKAAKKKLATKKR